MNSKRKVILYIAASLDGFIAGPNDDLSFLDLVQQPGQDYGYSEFINSIDMVIMGRKTYDWVMKQVHEFPHSDKKTYVITRTKRPNIGLTHFYSDNLEELVIKLKNETGKNIFIDGGAQIINQLLKAKLIDEIILSIIPVLLGTGIRLFDKGGSVQKLKLVSVKNFEIGLVQMHYELCK